MSICAVSFVLLTLFFLSNSFTLNPYRCNTNVKLSISNPQKRSSQLLAITPLVANGKRYEAESGSSMMLVSWSFAQLLFHNDLYEHYNLLYVFICSTYYLHQGMPEVRIESSDGKHRAMIYRFSLSNVIHRYNYFYEFAYLDHA